MKRDWLARVGLLIVVLMALIAFIFLAWYFHWATKGPPGGMEY
jgi:hypothetical protein